MKKYLLTSILLLTAALAFAKEDWRGKVVDRRGEPLQYANVALLSKSDSTVVSGTVTEEDGSYHLVTPNADGILMVAILGYRTQYLAPVDGAVITLDDDTALLEGAVATAVMPKTKLTGEGLQTSVHGTVLENAGTANDVLAKTPGIIKGQNGLEIVGKGTPLVYINGHKVTDPGELNRLQSNEIQGIEVITNPGAQYDATVRGVVRIRTIRRQGEGFGFNLNASDAQSLRAPGYNDPVGALGVNYRSGGVDIFAGLNYEHESEHQVSDAERVSFTSAAIRDMGWFTADFVEQNLHGNAGVNWQISDFHSIGGKLEWGRTLQQNTRSDVFDDVYWNGVLTDRLTTITRDWMGAVPPHQLGANLYYNGLIGEKVGIDLNLDYFGNGSSSVSESEETSTMSHDARIRANSSNDARMYAGKLVLSWPLGPVQLQAGTEETFSRRGDEYAISGIEIPASSATVTEDNYAGFASCAFLLGRAGQFNAGVRYEHVRYRYQDAVSPAENLDRTYDNWFPTASWANAFGSVNLMLNYSAKTKRPSYSQLSNAIRYNTRYIWQSGNAALQPEIIQNISLAAVWKFVTLMVDYNRTDDAIMSWSSPYNDEGVILVRPTNITTPFRAMSALVNFTPTIGIWTLNYTLGVQPQWLTINAPDPREASGFRVTRFNGKPIYFAQLFNTFTLRGGWQFELGAAINSRGYSENIYLDNVHFDLSAAVQKTLLRDGSLVLRLDGSDLAGLANYNIFSDFGSHTFRQTIQMDTQRVKISLRYVFNAAQSKYRGTGAGTDNKNRM